MIGDRELTIRRDANSTPWLVDIVWDAAGRLGHRRTFVNDLTTIEDDHVPFLRAGVAAVDIIDLDNPTGTRRRTPSNTSARAACRRWATSCWPPSPTSNARSRPAPADAGRRADMRRAGQASVCGEEAARG